jgi:hypothetical protein
MMVCFRMFKAGVITSLFCLFSVPSAPGQAPRLNAPHTEPLEKYNIPPAYIYRLETSSRIISQLGSFTSFQVNVDANGNNILGDAANEPSIAVNPTDLNKMAIGWRQFNSVNSDFRQGGYGYTSNGGATWTFRIKRFKPGLSRIRRTVRYTLPS